MLSRFLPMLANSSRGCRGRAESMNGVIPAVAIDQEQSSQTSRSTVGTMTEVCDHMKVLFARLGTMYSHPATSGARFTESAAKTLMKEMPDEGKAWVTFEYAPEEVAPDAIEHIEPARLHSDTLR